MARLKVGERLKPHPGRKFGCPTMLGTTMSIPVEVVMWTGMTNLMAIPIDDFQVILEIEFFQDNKAMPMPYLESL